MTEQRSAASGTPKSNLTRQEARTRAALVSDVRYDVDLELGQDDWPFGSEMRVRFRCAQPGASTFIDLLVGERDDLAGAVQSMVLNDRSLPPDAHQRSRARIRLDDLEADNELVVRATCLYGNHGSGLHRSRDEDGRVYLHTGFEPFAAHHVFACFDQPDLKATFSATVSAPQGWEVISCGRVLRRPGDGDETRFRFAPTLPISPYVFAVVAGPYHAVHRTYPSHGRELDLGIYCRQSLRQYLGSSEINEIVQITGEGFELFEELFGYPYPFDKYDQAFVPGHMAGAMENVGCVTINDAVHVFTSAVTEAERRKRAETLLHELAHMWFGDLVTMRWWDDLWLNEAFATYASNYALPKTTRYTGSWVAFHHAKTAAHALDRLPTAHPVAADDVVNADSVDENFDAITYQKGAAAVRQLVEWVGDDEGAFFNGLRSYFRRHQFANADVADFLRAVGEHAQYPLGDWPQLWLRTPGISTLRPELVVDGEQVTSFAILQETPEPPAGNVLRPHRLAVGLYRLDDGGRLVPEEKEALPVRVAASSRTEMKLGDLPAPDFVLVNDGDGGYARVRFDPRSLQTLATSLSTLDDPLTRAVCWTALWEMVTDGDHELAPRRYLDIALAHMGAEDEIANLRALLAYEIGPTAGRTAAAALTWVTPDHRGEALGRLADFAREAMTTAAGGSDRQRVWARAFAHAARTEAYLGELGAALEESQWLPGLQVDPGVRWHLVECLATAGVVDDAFIQAQLAHDATDNGKRHVEMARAAHPDGKDTAWEAITRFGEPADVTRMRMQGFMQPDQEEVLEPFRRRYFDQLGPAWDHDHEVGRRFAMAMYPLPHPETIRLTDDYLEADGVPAPIERVLVNGRTRAQRVLDAREGDAAPDQGGSTGGADV